MQDFLNQFGISWHLLLSQLVNFFLLLVVLRFFAYKPLLKMLKERRDRIQEGLAKAEEASVRLKEVDEIAEKKLKQADEQGISILKAVDEMKKKKETEIAGKIKEKEKELLKKAEEMAERQKREMYEKIQREGSEIIKTAIAKGVGIEPDEVDEKLIKKTATILNGLQF